MDLKHLSDQELLQNTLKADSDEKAATLVVLHHLCEVQRRRLFASVGVNSLFAYCIKVLRNSEPEASRKVNAARLLDELPFLEEKIHSGELALSTVSQAQTFFKQEAKSNNAYTTEQKKDLLVSLESQSTRKAVKILISKSSNPARSKEKVRPVADELTEIKLLADSELIEDLERLQEIWSHDMPGASFQDVIRKMAKVCRKREDPLLQSPRHKATPTPKSPRHIPAKVS